MEYRAKDPGGEAKVGEELVVRPEGVAGWDEGADLLETLPVSPEVAEREEHGEGLLDAEEAVKGPFAVELDDFVVGSDTGGGDDVLAGVVAFGGAVPEEEAARERCSFMLVKRAFSFFRCLVDVETEGESYGWELQLCRERSFRICRSVTKKKDACQ
jgi:hypothetical protein